VELNQYGYNFQGKFTYNPQTSVSVSNTEISEMKETLYNQYNLELDYHPGEVFFMKDFSIGFIIDYQLGVKKKKYCKYYDIHERACKIHPIRPAACRTYPLIVNLNNPIFPTIEGTCNFIIEELRKQFPNQRNGSGYQINNFELIDAFFFEFITHKVSFNYLLSQFRLLRSNLGFLFLDSQMINPEKIEKYELIDFSQFFQWILTHINDQKILQIVEDVQLKLNELQLEFAKKIESWKNNPYDISVYIT